MKRRDFFKRVGMAVGAAVLGKEIVAKQPIEANVIRYRSGLSSKVPGSDIDIWCRGIISPGKLLQITPNESRLNPNADFNIEWIK